MTPTLPDWIAEHGARERARSRRVFWTRIRIYAVIGWRWLATLGAAGWHMSAGAIVAFPFLLLLASAAWVVA